MRTLITLLFVTLTLAANLTFAQRVKELKAKGTYVHAATGTEFPETIGSYKRISIRSFDKNDENIGCSYKLNQTVLSIYLYPAGNGWEDRLRGQYQQALQDMATAANRELHAEQNYNFYEKDGFKVNGFTGTVSDYSDSRLTVFECGKWFLKFRISSNDTTGMRKLERQALDVVDPIRIVKSSPLALKHVIDFAPAAKRDSTMLISVLGSALRKLAWARQQVDSLERIAGFPDIYLEMHTESLKTFVELAERDQHTRKAETSQYIAQVKRIIDSGFLEEFVMEQFQMIIISREGVVPDFEGYEKWKRENQDISLDLTRRFYLVGYE